MPSIQQFKDVFFDSPKVKRAVDRALRRKLSRFGSFVRTRSKSSIKKAPKVDVKTGLITRKRKNVTTREAISKPGAVPFAHGRQLAKRFILFGYEAKRKSVVIGPARIGGKEGLEALEYGGTAQIRRPRRGIKTGRYAARPFMRPARDAELPNFMNSLQDSVRG